MTAKELQKRNERAQKLRVIQADDDSFYVESSEGKICYRVMTDEDNVYCSCGDFNRNIKTDSTFKCKHIISVLNCIPAGDVESAQFLEKTRPKLDDRFIMKIEGKEFVMYPGLLDLGHQKGILRIEVDPLQYPTKENGNFAICKSTVVSKTGETFIDVGDANPTNCNSRVAKHLLRMASTRSIARALRSFTNIGMTCLEELADFNDVIAPKTSKPAKKTKKAPAKKSNSNGSNNKAEAKDKEPKVKTESKPKDNDKDKKEPVSKSKSTKKDSETDTQKEESTAPKMSKAQLRAVYNLSRRRGISVEELENMVMESYKAPLEELSSKEASEFIRSLQQAA